MLNIFAWRMIKRIFFILTSVLICVLYSGCTSDNVNNEPGPEAVIEFRQLEEIIDSDTLRVATLSESASYFVFRNEIMGYNYELVRNFAKYLKVQLKISIAQTEQELVDMLTGNEIDLIAYNLFETSELKEKFQFISPYIDSRQVLVQKFASDNISNVTELAGKDVYVKENNVIHRRLLNLNNEIGGGINIIPAPDSLTNDDLIEMVLNDEIPYTVSFQYLAAAHRKNTNLLNHTLAVGFTQQSGWVVHKEALDLQKEYDNWYNLSPTLNLRQSLAGKYQSRNPYFSIRKLRIPAGNISPYDDIFKKYAPKIDWDWRLLASLAFHESAFDSTIVSSAGAAGLMQLMPRTAENFGLDSVTIFNPEKNLSAAIEYLLYLERMFKKVQNRDERAKFMIASYNSGPAHVLDAMALAEKYGKNPYVWNDVEYFLNLKKDPTFYEDPVVKYGSFNATETIRYVENTMDTYRKYMGAN